MKRILIALLLVASLSWNCNKEEPTVVSKRPFPQNIQYPSNYILPNTMSQDELNKYVENYYDGWKKRYIKQCNDGTYYVDFTDEDPNVATVSEAMGYGMVITAYMGGYDPEAKEIFDGLFKFYKSHPSKICKYFMNWRQNTNCESTGDDSATDGDEDAAFALLLADAQWGSNGEINYKQEAIDIINALKSCAFHIDGYPLLGDWVETSSSFATATRSSDWMLDHYLAYYTATNDTFWLLSIKKISQITDSIQTNYSPNTGIIPDFIVNASTSPQPAPPNFLESEYDGAMYYNACRTPWRLATGQLFSADISFQNALDKLNNWIITQTGGNAQNIMAGYKLDGTPVNNYQDICFTGGFAVSAMLSGNQDWLNSCFNALIEPSIDDNTYFGNTLRMLYLIVLSGNYWLP